MEKIIEISHNKSFEELKPKMLKKMESLRNAYAKEIDAYQITHNMDEKNGVLVVSCDKYNISWYLVFLQNTLQLYEEAPVFVKPFIEIHRQKFVDVVSSELKGAIE